MPLKFGTLLVVIGLTSWLTACSTSVQTSKSSGEIEQPITEIVEPDGEGQLTDDQDVFLLEQQTPEGDIVESSNAESSELSEYLEKSPSN